MLEAISDTFIEVNYVAFEPSELADSNNKHYSSIILQFTKYSIPLSLFENKKADAQAGYMICSSDRVRK